MKNTLLRVMALGALLSTVFGSDCSPLTSTVTRANTSCSKNNCCNTQAHTFFRPRPLSQNLALEESLTYYHRWQNDQACNGISLEAAPYYYRSTKNNRIGQYFAPGCNNCVTIEKITLPKLARHGSIF